MISALYNLTLDIDIDKIKRKGLIFHVFGQTLPHGRFVPNLGYEFVSST